MKTSVVIVFIFGLLAAGCSSPTYLSLTEYNREQLEEKIINYELDENVGARVTAALKNGAKFSGELLFVRDSTLTICTKYQATEEDLAKFKYPITNVRNDEIQVFTIEGDSYVWTGVGYGMLGGAIIGALLGVAISDEDFAGQTGLMAIFGASIGLLMGAIIGTAVGDALSTFDVNLYEIPLGYDLSFLKPIARYPEEEPEYLRVIE